ncbi:MAG: cytochrome o ubiquinol oxidase subunit III [Neisseriaceae bacterium]|nr:cytochrome o ubiquinol oxidase subunit III [Neisseriaceae bacterium]MBP6861836.1 cytochrome o ubiquinol oxidase subunit III [Neisseriaceae bacterium]
MSHPNPTQAAPTAEAAHQPHHDHDDQGKTPLGFWLYLMSDCLLFASLFATYAVLVGGVANGPSDADIVNLPLILISTILLLFSSFTFGMGLLAARAQRLRLTLLWLGATFILGLGFIALEAYEFYELIIEGYGPQRSAFLSAFFTLVGTHGLHVVIGLLWLLILGWQLYRKGLTAKNRIRLTCLSLFWHFLDLIWICVFTVVYLMGAIR